MKATILASAIVLASACAAHADSYADGRRDWTDLKAWQNGLSDPYRQGVEWWAGNRSVAGHASCESLEGPPGAYSLGDDLEFRAGCRSSRDRLATIDARRNTDPAYRNGFNDGARNAPWPVQEPAPIPHVELPPVYVTPDSPSRTAEAACNDAYATMQKLMRRQLNNPDANVTFNFQGGRYDGHDTYRCYMRATVRGEEFRSGATFSMANDVAFKVELLSGGNSMVTLLP